MRSTTIHDINVRSHAQGWCFIPIGLNCIAISPSFWLQVTLMQTTTPFSQGSLLQYSTGQHGIVHNACDIKQPNQQNIHATRLDTPPFFIFMRFYTPQWKHGHISLYATCVQDQWGYSALSHVSISLTVSVRIETGTIVCYLKTSTVNTTLIHRSKIHKKQPTVQRNDP